MVKPDLKHNYYADLDLPPSCSIDDIKKQYRKLALLYHPDRNAGKEDEYVPKFQAIQTAHEVLGDPTIKQRYDADRRVGGGVGGGSSQFRSSRPTPGNAYPTTSAYPPPPRRTQPGTWQRQKPAAQSKPSGANRYPNFGPGIPTAQKDPAQERANVYRAWQHMPAGGQANSSTPPRTRPQPPPRPDVPRPNDNEARPSTPHAKNHAGHEPDTAEQRQAAWTAFQQSNAHSNAHSNAGRPSMGRTPSHRTPRKGGFDPNAPGSDERPAGGYGYTHRNRDDNLTPDGTSTQRYPPPPPPPSRRPYSPMTPTTPPKERPQPFADPLRPFKSRLSSEEVPFSEANRLRTPYSNISGEKTSFSSEGLRRSASTRDTTKLDRPQQSPSSRARSSSPVRTKPAPPQETDGPFVNYTSTESSAADSEDEESPPTPQVNPADRQKKIPKRPSARINRSSSMRANSNTYSPQKPDMEQKSGTNIFSIPIFEDTFSPAGARSRSEENINTEFSGDKWNGNFQGPAEQFDDFPQSKQRTTQSPGGKYRPRPSHRASTNSRSAYTSGPSTPIVDSAQFTAEPAQENLKFSQQEWEKTFKDGSWAWEPLPRTSSPTKSRNKVPGRKPVSKASTNYQPPPESYTSTNDVPVMGPDDAMDLDPVPPVEQANVSNQEPRLYSVPPSAWRQQHQAPTPLSPERPPPPAAVPLRTNLDDFRHVEPIMPGNEGLLDLNDIGATLPFESQASSIAPGQSSAPQKLQIPSQPRVPDRPAKLTVQSWNRYAHDFGKYIQSYHVFESHLLQHFAARERQFQILTANGYGWVQAVGDTVSAGSAAPSGFASYLKNVREDAQAREAWTTGARNFTEALEAFDLVRERVKQLAGSGALAAS